MRKTFIKTLTELAEKDSNIYLLTADMGFGMVEPFSEKYPDKFINVGVAEQNMIGIATGLALSGKIVFCYSIANFPTLRCLEQIRNDICYHNVRVHIVAGGVGLNYGALGSSHHTTEDVSIMRSLPNMTVICPSDIREAEGAVRAMYKSESPCYMRLGYYDGKTTYDNREFKIGKASTIVSGLDATIITTGSMLNVALEAVDKLNRCNIYPTLINMHTIKPIDSEAIINESKISNIILTIEEHNLIGGLGSAVAEVIADNSLKVKFIRMGIPDVFCTQVMNRDNLLKCYGLTSDEVVKRIKDAIR
jgi:transketolase